MRRSSNDYLLTNDYNSFKALKFNPLLDCVTNDY